MSTLRGCIPTLSTKARAVIASITLGGLALAGCTGDNQDGKSATSDVQVPQLAWQQVDIPAEFGHTEHNHDMVGLLAPAGSAPWLSVVNRQYVTDADKPMIKTSTDGKDWFAVTVDWAAGDDDVNITDLVELKDSVAMLVTKTNDAGGRSQEIWTSTDRKAWQKSDQKVPENTTRLLGFTDEFCFVAEPNNMDHKIHCADKPVLEVSGKGNGFNSWVGHAAQSGNTWILAHAVGTKDEKHPMIFWSSTDQGATWAPLELLPMPADDIHSVTGTASGFLAVGNTDGKAMSWTSPDGRTWTAEKGLSAAAKSNPDVWWLSGSTAFSQVQTTADGTAYAVMADEGVFYHAAVKRNPDGIWDVIEEFALPHDEPSHAMAMSDAGAGVFWWAAGNNDEAFKPFDNTTELVGPESKMRTSDGRSWFPAAQNANTAMITNERRATALLPHQGGFATFYGGTALTLKADGVDQSNPLPLPQQGLVNHLAGAATGTEVSVATNGYQVITKMITDANVSYNAHLVASVRNPGGQWENATLPAEETKFWEPQSVFHDGTRFIATAYATNEAGVPVGKALQSTDGKTWTVANTGLEGATPAVVTTGCHQAEGTTRAVGYVTLGEDDRALASFTFDGTSWTVHQHDSAKANDTRNLNCVVKDGKTYVSNGDLVQTSWFSMAEDGKLTKLGDLAESVEMHGATTIGDRLVTYGVDQDSPAHSAAAFWTSTDGKEWTKHDAPAGLPVAKCLLHNGDQVYLCGRKNSKLSLWSAAMKPEIFGAAKANGAAAATDSATDTATN